MSEERQFTSKIYQSYREVIARGLVASDGRPFQVIGVTKTLPPELISEGYQCGIRDFGENYADELIEKASHRSLIFDVDSIRWHFIGAIQSRKIAKLASFVSVWHSVARAKEVEIIASEAPRAQIFIQVKMDDQEHRNGVSLGGAADLVDLAKERNLQVLGLMVVPPLVKRKKLEEIFAAVNSERIRLGLECSSMGMSSDFELALSRGSTHIRVGTSIFGGRDRISLGSNLGQGGPR